MTPTVRIPFNRASLVADEMSLMQEAVALGHISGDGTFTKQCSELLADMTGAKRVLLTTSCTHALEMTALLLDIKPGDEVVLPSFTFVSAVNAFVLRGATPVFVDIQPDTLNIDPAKLEARLTDRTKAIVVMHYAGIACEMEAIGRIAASRGIPIVEDNAHGLLGAYCGRPLGSFGAMSTLSFHETKNFTCGEGGALAINDASLIDRAEIIREKGTNRSRFFRGQVDKYSWVDIGSSYLPSELLAAFLLAQLRASERVQARRREIWTGYAEGLAGWAQAADVRLPSVPRGASQSYHIFYLILPDLERRQAFIAHLRARGIMAVFHYVPLHLSDMGRRFGGRSGDCPITEDLSDRLVRLPLYFSLTPDDQASVIDACRTFKVRAT